MVQIDDKLISLDVFERHFICDLPKCMGACCVEGESGAPLEEEETRILEEIFPVIKPMLGPASLKEIERVGTWEVDGDGDKVTPIINGRECVYAYYDEKGVDRKSTRLNSSHVRISYAVFCLKKKIKKKKRINNKYLKL